jgi:DNA-binding YbaB/EbfC family protein
MKNLGQMMKQAQQMQEKMTELQESLAKIEVTGRSGGGMVTVTINGKSEMCSLTLDPSLSLEKEREMLEDLVLAAHNDAKAKLEITLQEETSKLMGGLELPPGMKLPF